MERERIMRIASHQRRIILLMLAYLAAWSLTLAVAVGAASAPPLMLVAFPLALLVIGIVIAGVVATVRMASALHGQGVAVLSAILLPLPLVEGMFASSVAVTISTQLASLVTLLVLDLQAIRTLRRAGLTVGFLGVPQARAADWRWH
ncbi:MAG TPA: hypothetical protein VK932_16730 [Kofleriaceae bacterium]|nr:hypothetical protein [Kofleriaceae bacterium]